MQTIDQYLALEPKRVPDSGPVDAWMYHLPYGEWITAQASQLNPGTWVVIGYAPDALTETLASGLDEGKARDYAHGMRLWRLAELTVWMDEES